jgi:hypothetical protein
MRISARGALAPRDRNGREYIELFEDMRSLIDKKRVRRDSAEAEREDEKTMGVGGLPPKNTPCWR